MLPQRSAFSLLFDLVPDFWRQDAPQFLVKTMAIDCSTKKTSVNVISAFMWNRYYYIAPMPCWAVLIPQKYTFFQCESKILDHLMPSRHILPLSSVYYSRSCFCISWDTALPAVATAAHRQRTLAAAAYSRQPSIRASLPLVSGGKHTPTPSVNATTFIAAAFQHSF